MDAVLFGLLKKVKSVASNIKIDLANKLDKNQGIENSGKIVGIDESGNIIPVIPSGVTYNEETNCLEYGRMKI